MKTINYLIVEIDNTYNNEIELQDGESIIVNSTIENVEFINRISTVVSSPNFTIIKKGDKVIAHHNTFRSSNGVGGVMVGSNYHIKDNLYFIPLSEVFMYKRGDSQWTAIEPYCFVKPIEYKDDSFFSTEPKDITYKGRLHKRGILSYPNNNLLKQGVNVGDTVLFTKNSEYEFIIDGEVYYKMATKDIIGVV